MLPCKETYDAEKYGSRNPIAKYLIGNLVEVIGDLIHTTGARSIADAGCGEGHFLSCLLTISPDLNGRLEGFDIEDELLKVAGQICPTIKFEKQDIYNLSYDDCSYDLVVATEVLEHIEHPQLAVKELKRISRQYCLFSVPNEPFFRICTLMRGKYVLRLGNKPNHLHAWSSGQFVKLLESHFEIVSVRKPLPWTVVLCRKDINQYVTCQNSQRA